MKKLGIFRRVLLAFGAEDFTIGDLQSLGLQVASVQSLPDLTARTQLEIATQEALAASLELIGVLQAMWNDLSDQLDERSLVLGVSDSTSERIMNLEDRLNAAMVVARESFAENGIEIAHDC